MRKIKIERIDKKQKVLLIGAIMTIGIVVTLILITSKAKYKNIESIDLASGTINYSPADFDLFAIQIENESGNYESSTAIPSSGYVLSDDSYCNVDGVKDSSVVLTYQNGKVGASNISRKVKCYLYFDKEKGLVEKMKLQSKGEKTSFTGIATAADTGIYSAPDDYGISYYFRGLEGSLNNWVKFAGFYWRIIRGNGNGTIRMIYSGAASGNVSSSNKTGTTTQLTGTSKFFNSTSYDNTYVGYMNNGGNTNSYDTAHQNIVNSSVKTEIDNWYQNNIANNVEYSKHIDTNTGFCNDRELSIGTFGYTGSGYGKQGTGYAPLGRLYNANSGWNSTQSPTLQCSNKSRDLFTVNSANEGNKKLTYPVGLITSDEVVFAGGFGGANNTSYYLYTNKDYWTMSPISYNAVALVFFVYSNGLLEHPYLYNIDIGFRPVINLKADTKFTYNNEITKGSETDPFVVV